MADITSYGPIRRLRSEPTIHTLRFRRGTLAAEARGLAFLFRPAVTGVAEVPVDDRDATFLFRARTSDFQQVTIQGVLTYRVEDPARLADRVDFTIDLRDGTWRKEPLEQVAGLLTQLAQQATLDLVATLDLREAVRVGIDRVRSVVTEQLVGDDRLADLGLAIVAVRVHDVQPTSEMEAALQTPVQEAVQQQADEARFSRRALAVDKERAIAENELANRLELARREEDLIGQQATNRRREVIDDAETERLATEAELEQDRTRATTRRELERLEAEAMAANTELRAEANATAMRTTSEAEAASTTALGEAEAIAAQAMMDVQREVPMQVHLGLALRELAGTLEHVDHLNLSPDSIGPLLTTLMAAGTRRLEAEEVDA